MIKSLFELFFGEGSWRQIFGPNKQERKVMDKWQEEQQKGTPGDNYPPDKFGG